MFAEVLIPETPNVYGDFWTKAGIIDAAYKFMQYGFGVDVEHSNIDIQNSVYVVESFIARAGDPDFIPGSWVVGMRIDDMNIWQDVLDNNINGFSYEALVQFFDATFIMQDSGVRTGATDPVLDGDGHVHEFLIMVDENTRPISGGTNEVNGHSHTITTGTVTDEAEGHTHRYTLVTGKGGK